MTTTTFRSLRRALPDWLLFAILSFLLSVTIIQNANWVFGDDHEFLVMLINQHFRSLLALKHLGRFNPLQYQELRWLTLSPWAFSKGRFAACLYVCSMASFVVFSVSIFVHFRTLAKNTLKRELALFPLAAAAYVSIVLVPSFMMVFWRIIFPERMVVVLYAVFATVYYRAVMGDKRRHYIGAFVCLVLMTYYKEPAVLLTVPAAVLWLVFAWRTLTRRHKVFNWAIVLNAVTYLVLYYTLVYRGVTHFYNMGRVQQSSAEIAWNVLRNHHLFIFAFAFGLLRMGAILLRRSREHLLHDGMLFSGLAYIAAYWMLRLPDSYYYLPAYVPLASVLFYWICCAGRTLVWLPYVAVGLIFSLVLWTNSGVSRREYKGNQAARLTHMQTAQLVADAYDAGGRIYYQHLREGLALNPVYADAQLSYLLWFTRFCSSDSATMPAFDVVQGMDMPKHLSPGDLIILPPINRTNTEFMDAFARYQVEAQVKCITNAGYDVFRTVDGIEIPFTFDFSVTDLPSAGLSSLEREGRWSNAETVQFSFRLSKSCDTDIVAQFDVMPFLLQQKLPRRKVVVHVNGQPLATWEFATDVQRPTLCEVRIPKALCTNQIMSFRFDTTPVISPLSLQHSADERKLGLFFRRLTFAHVEVSP